MSRLCPAPVTARMLLALLAGMTTACGPLGEAPAPGPAPTPVDDAAWPAGASGHYTIQPAGSELRVLVYRAGPLARLGHNHVISHRRLSGQVQLQPGRASFRVRAGVAAFEVDPAELRALEGPDFATRPDAEAVAGTRENLLGEEVLAAGRHPVITLEGETATRRQGPHTLAVAIGFRGRVIRRQVPARVSLDGELLLAEGTFTLTHGELGLTPFRALGGMLAVAEELTVRYRVLARRDR